MPIATLGDVRLYYEDAGSGAPLLLIAGRGNDHLWWAGAVGGLVASHRVITYDHRGIGASDKPAEPPYTLAMLARDAIGLLDCLGISRAHALGISMGGRICQWLGISYPDRVGSLVLGCTTPGDAHGVRRPAEATAALDRRWPDPARRAVQLTELLVSPEWYAAHPTSSVVRRTPVPPFVQRFQRDASESHDSWELLPTITAPTLVLHGTDDQLAPVANAYLLRDRIPGAELHLITGGRHGCFHEYNAEAVATVLDFLRQHPMPTPT